MQDGASGNTGRMDLLMQIVREQGEHGKAIQVLEGTVRQATTAVQEAARDIKEVKASAPKIPDCDAEHEKLADKIVRRLDPAIKVANGKASAAVAATEKKVSKFWPRDFLGIAKMIGILVGVVVGAVLFGGWLTERGLMPGSEKAEIQPLEINDPLLIEVQKLNQNIEKLKGSAGSTEPSWGKMGFASE